MHLEVADVSCDAPDAPVQLPSPKPRPKTCRGFAKLLDIDLTATRRYTVCRQQAPSTKVILWNGCDSLLSCVAGAGRGTLP